MKFIKLFLIINLTIYFNSASAVSRIACEKLPMDVHMNEARKLLNNELGYGIGDQCKLRRWTGVVDTFNDVPLISAICTIRGRNYHYTIWGENTGGIFTELKCEGFYLQD